MPLGILATAYGGPDVLALEQVDIGAPGPGQVLVEVRAAGVNPIDYKLYSSAGTRGPAKLPMRLGFEAAGQVKAVGEGAEGPAGPLHPGDEVIAYPVQGAYATELVARASSVLPKPAAMSAEQAGGLMLTGVTAFHAASVARVRAGDTVVVHGAAGGVGLMAVQLAADLGARVIGTASESGHAYLRQLGAEPVTYGDGLAGRIRGLAPNGVDAAIDTVGTDEAVETSLALVADRERIVSIAAFRRGPALGIKLLGQGPGADPGTEIRSAARLELLRLVDEDKLRVVVTAIYPLAEAADAHRTLMAGHTHGKIVLVP